jgi:hypothetical protein
MFRLQGSDRRLENAAELQNAASGLPATNLPPGMTLCPDTLDGYNEKAQRVSRPSVFARRYDKD